jgi:glutathione synthase/RimK-type ligase-like ATP-grasp enzyme
LHWLGSRQRSKAVSSSQRRDGIDDADTRLSAVWLRRPSPPVAHPEIGDPTLRSYAEAECASFIEGVWHALPSRWVPAIWPVIERAAQKPTQLRLAGELGLELPPTLITNDPARFLEFYDTHDGNLVSKLPSPAMTRTLGRSGVARYTQQVTRRDVGYADSIRYAPVIFQVYVPKRVELRITVVGEQVFAAEIHSQSANRTRLDWRRYDLQHTPHHPHALPDGVQRSCVELVRRLGLCFGAIDMVLTPDGRYVFLEINPNGQFLWIERAAGLPICDAICDLLVADRRMAAERRAA